MAHPKVAEAAVVGYPHDIKGQGIYCYVTLMAGETGDDALPARQSEQQIRGTEDRPPEEQRGGEESDPEDQPLQAASGEELEGEQKSRDDDHEAGGGREDERRQQMQKEGQQVERRGGEQAVRRGERQRVGERQQRSGEQPDLPRQERQRPGLADRLERVAQQKALDAVREVPEPLELAARDLERARITHRRPGPLRLPAALAPTASATAHEVDQRAQHLSLAPEGRHRGERKLEQLVGERARSRHPEQLHESQLGGVLPGVLAGLGAGREDVQEIVLDLKGEPQVLGEGADRFEVAAARVDRHRSELRRRQEKGAGLVAVDVLEVGERRRAAAAREIERLAADEALGIPPLDIGRHGAEFRRSQEQRAGLVTVDVLEIGKRRRGRATRQIERLAADQPGGADRLRQVMEQLLRGVARKAEPLRGFGNQCVAAIEQSKGREQGDVLAKLAMQRRPAAAQLGVVHGRQVIEHQRAAVDELDRAGEVQRVVVHVQAGQFGAPQA